MKIDDLGFTEVGRAAGRQVRRPAAVRGGRRRGRSASRARSARADRGAPGRRRPSTPSAGDARGRRSARQFLGERGFDQAAAEQFGVGFAPRDGDALLRHLRAEGLHRGGAGRGRPRRGRATRPYDRFRGRLLWPIRDVERRVDRLRRAPALRRRPDRGEVPQHPRDPDLQEEPGALRPRPGPARHRAHDRRRSSSRATPT